MYIGNGTCTSATALEYATRMKYHDVVAVLQEAGAGAEEGSDDAMVCRNASSSESQEYSTSLSQGVDKYF